jgi:hypothetical protein
MTKSDQTQDILTTLAGNMAKLRVDVVGARAKLDESTAAMTSRVGALEQKASAVEERCAKLQDETLSKLEASLAAKLASLETRLSARVDRIEAASATVPRRPLAAQPVLALPSAGGTVGRATSGLSFCPDRLCLRGGAPVGSPVQHRLSREDALQLAKGLLEAIPEDARKLVSRPRAPGHKTWQVVSHLAPQTSMADAYRVQPALRAVIESRHVSVSGRPVTVITQREDWKQAPNKRAALAERVMTGLFKELASHRGLELRCVVGCARGA